MIIDVFYVSVNSMNNEEGWRHCITFSKAYGKEAYCFFISFTGS
jgi:hypothetical protein